MSQTDIMATGTYTGNGGTQSISIGWQPAAVFITSTANNPNNQRSWSLKIDSMPGDDYQANDTTANHVTTNGVTMVADGFDLGSGNKVNKNGVVYYWIAFRAGAAIDTGTYTGDGINGRVISTGRQPAMVLIAEVTGELATIWKHGNVPVRLSNQFQEANDHRDCVSMVSDGFELSNAASANVNVDTETYYWMAIYDFDGSTRHVETGLYDGDDPLTPPFNPQTITRGLQPKFVFIYGRDLGAISDWFFVNDQYVNNVSSISSGHTVLNTDPDIVIISTGFEVRGGTNDDTHVDYSYVTGYF